MALTSRHKPPAVLLIVSTGVVAAQFLGLIDRSAPSWVPMAAIWIYVVGAVWWSAVSVGSPSGALVRLAMIWAPSVAPIAWVVGIAEAMKTQDYAAMAIAIAGPPAIVVVLASLSASGWTLLTDGREGDVG